MILRLKVKVLIVKGRVKFFCHSKNYDVVELQVGQEAFFLNLGKKEHSNFSLKLIYICLIVKHVLTTYLNHSRVHFMESTSTGVI